VWLAALLPRGRVRRTMAVVALALLLGAGCAGERWTYSKRGLTPARLDQDLEACRRDAHRPYTFGLSRSGRLDHEAVRLCMQRKGYTAQRDD
jgi:hypothetical protein